MTNEQILKKAGISKKEYDAIHQWVNGYTLMTNEEILHKAIEKAEKKGYHTPFVWISDRGKEILKDMAREGNTSCYSIIFSHDFAISFYGKEWKKRLKEQVLEVNPLDYIRKYLD